MNWLCSFRYKIRAFFYTALLPLAWVQGSVAGGAGGECDFHVKIVEVLN